jgi:hypothetical protein
VLILCVAQNNATDFRQFTSDVDRVTDEGGNFWTKVSEYTFIDDTYGGTTIAVFFTKATASPEMVTVTFSNPAHSKAAEVRRFTVNRPVAVKDYTWLGVFGYPGSMTLNAPAKEYLWLRAIASRQPNTEEWTHTSGYTGFNGAGLVGTPSQSINGEFIIAEGSSQTSNPITSLAYGSRASLFIAFEETPISISNSDTSVLSSAENLSLSRNLAYAGTLTAAETLQLARGFKDDGTIVAIEQEQATPLIAESDSGILSALEAQSQEIQYVISDTDASTLGGTEQLVLARNSADAGTLLSDEAIVFKQARADTGTFSAAENLTAARTLGDTGIFTAGEAAIRTTLFIINEADAGVLADAESQGISKFSLKTPPALRVTNYLRRTA